MRERHTQIDATLQAPTHLAGSRLGDPSQNNLVDGTLVAESLRGLDDAEVRFEFGNGARSMH